MHAMIDNESESFFYFCCWQRDNIVYQIIIIKSTTEITVKNKIEDLKIVGLKMT